MNKTTVDRLNTNNFDLLRVLLALTVCFVHASQLSGFQELMFIQQVMSAKIAVKAFFIVSGFLIFMSYERSSSLKSYFNKRLRRIMPAYIFIVLACALGLSLMSELDYQDYYLSPDWFKYVWSNLVFLNFLQPTLPSVFTSNIAPFVNGALWTIKIEVMFYISVPFFVFLFRKTSTLTVLLTFYVLSVAFLISVTYLYESTGGYFYKKLMVQFPSQLSYFLAGGAIYYYRNFFEKYIKHFLTCAVILLFFNSGYISYIIEPTILAIIVIFLVLFNYLGNAGKYGDFSYGIYICHFPIIQICVSLNLFYDQPWLFFILVVLLSVLAGFFMWHIVEKRFLSKRSHYVLTTKSR